MRNLGNGMYEITNKRTGERKVIPASELSSYGISVPSATPTPTQPQQSGGLPPLVKAGLPIAGGAIGTAVGGPGVGALSAAGGQALSNLLERATGGSPPQTIGENAFSLAGAAGQQLAGEGLASLLGVLASPMRFLGGKVNKILASSTKGINLNELLKAFEQNLPPTVGKMAGKGVETDVALSELKNRVAQMVESRLPYQGSMDNVPVAMANEIKRAVPKLGNLLSSPAGNTGRTVGDMFGELAGPGYEVPKAFVNMLKEQIAKAEPGVRLPNALMHGAYALNDVLEGLSYALPWQTGRAARGIVNTMGSLPGKLIPEGGGVLRYLFPGIIQSGMQAQ